MEKLNRNTLCTGEDEEFYGDTWRGLISDKVDEIVEQLNTNNTVRDKIIEFIGRRREEALVWHKEHEKYFMDGETIKAAKSEFYCFALLSCCKELSTIIELA